MKTYNYQQMMKENGGRPGLNDEQIAAFRANGFLLMEDILSPADLQPLIDEIDAVIAGAAGEAHAAGKLCRLFADEPFERRFASIYENIDEPHPFFKLIHGKAHKTPGLFRLMSHPNLLDIAESLVGPEVMFHPQFNAHAKLPRQPEMEVPWHQDMTFLQSDVDGTAMVNFWIAMVDVTLENGTLEVMAGSHKHGLLEHELCPPPLMFPRRILAARVPQGEVYPCILRKGGAALFTHKTLHRSFPNESAHVRWTLDLRYQNATQPTGRPDVPGLLLRSRRDPDKVIKSREQWLKLWEGTGHEKY